jgi:hypothetical protein
MRYFIKVLLGIDQFANTLIGGAPDETISARAGRRRNAGTVASKLFWKPLANTLDFIQDDHVEKAICHEADGSQQDEAYRDIYDPEDVCEVKNEPSHKR